MIFDMTRRAFLVYIVLNIYNIAATESMDFADPAEEILESDWIGYFSIFTRFSNEF